jgi:hypothetical protein
VTFPGPHPEPCFPDCLACNLKKARALNAKLMRAVEFQAAQILGDGHVVLSSSIPRAPWWRRARWWAGDRIARALRRMADRLDGGIGE